MSTHQLFQIFIKFDKKNPTNCKNYDRKLVKFIKNNINILNSRGNVLDLILVDKNNKASISKLKHKRGAERFPVLFIKKNKVEGATNITKFLSRLCRGNATVPLMNNDEMIHEYQMRQIGDSTMGLMQSYDDDEYDTSDRTCVARAAEETQRRQERFNARDGRRRRKFNMSHRGKQFRDDDNDDYDDEDDEDSDIDERPKRRKKRRGRNVTMKDSPADIEKTISTRGNPREVDLMAGFWENQEETSLSN